MEQAEPTSGPPAEEPAYRYHRWRDTVVRQRGRSFEVETLTPAGWAYDPYALDAVVGMGEDPYSCGEWCDELTAAEAARIAASMGLSLATGGAEGESPAPRA